MTAVSSHGDGLTLRSAPGRWVLLATILGSALASIDATVVAIALPAIGADLSVPFADLQWTVTGYTLTLAALILLGGASGDRFGRRRVFLIGVVWFAVASVLCAIAPTVLLLVAARVVQGAGAALLTPASLAILEASFDPEDRGAAVATWAGFAGIAGALAPLVGGWLLDLGSWRWVFVANLPLALIVVVLALRHVPETRDDGDGRTGQLDWLGSVATVVCLGSLTYAVIAVGTNVPAAAIFTAATIAVASAGGLIVLERRASQPVLPLELFRVRPFSVVNVMTLLAYGAIGAFFLLSVLQLQVVAGWSPLLAGLSSFPVTVLTLVFSRASGRVAGRLGPRPQLIIGPLLCGGGVLLALRIDGTATFVLDVLPSMLVLGLGLAVMVAPLTATALGSVPASHAGVASGVNNAVARTGSLLAIAAIPVLAGITGDVFDDPQRFDAGFRVSMLLCAALFVTAALAAALFLPRARQQAPPKRSDRPFGPHG